jgi:hypothetical protein
VHGKRRNEDFCRDNADLIARIGVQPLIMDDQDHFMHYLEHEHGVPRLGLPVNVWRAQ